MTIQLNSMIDRAGSLLIELERVYTRDLEAHEVSADALNITHEVVEKCSNILDQAMALAFKNQIKPTLKILPKRGGYFPAASDEQAYRSNLGQWNAADLDVLVPDLDYKLRSLQPFSDKSNTIFARIKALASKKHTSLEPQVRKEKRRVNVTRQGQGSITWGPGVIFGSGVSVMGAPINDLTQLPMPTPGVDVVVETWISFHFEDSGEDALMFCRSAVQAARRAVKTIFN